MHHFMGTWEPFVPPTGQRLFARRNFKGRIMNFLQRRLVQGGITMEIAVTGPATEEESNDLFQREMARLIVAKQ
jgi:hypothetical protein